MSGWIKLHRKIQDNWLWEDKPFSKCHAWIDLILSANHKEKKVMIKNQLLTVKRGQSARSEITLTKTWGWSRGKVRAFLSTLQSEQMIVQQKNNVTSIITILNYEDLQQTGQQKDTEQDSRLTPDCTPNEHQTVHKQECKELKEEKNVKKKDKEEREKEFYEKLASFKETYSSDLLREFYNYWTEAGEKDKKMRFEKEKSYDVKRRLATWKNRQKDFSVNKIQTGSNLPDFTKMTEDEYIKHLKIKFPKMKLGKIVEKYDAQHCFNKQKAVYKDFSPQSLMVQRISRKQLYFNCLNHREDLDMLRK